jgi:hypothetical protein
MTSVIKICGESQDDRQYDNRVGFDELERYLTTASKRSTDIQPARPV